MSYSILTVFSYTEEKRVWKRNSRSVTALSAGEYTTTWLVMVDRVKGGGRALPTLIMMDCTLESGHCQSICILSSLLSNMHIMNNLC
jgi:hypothetical protein